MKQYAIVGFGCAGYHAAKRLRQLCPEDEIHIYERTERGGANPMLTTYYAGGRIGFEQMFPFGDMRDICRTFRLELHSQPVVRVEAADRRVVTADGESCQYHKILIATGASALLPAFLHIEGRDVFLMRTVQDAEALRTYVQDHQVDTAAVIGASMVGIKVAELLHSRGIKTTLLDAADYIFPLAAYPETAQEISQALEAQGLRLRMGMRISGVNAGGVVLSDGGGLPADLVCICIGTRANVELVSNTQVLEGQGVELRRGIVINTRMETSAAGIYAAGDCCEGCNLQTGESTIIGLWANAAAQGQCAGSNMAGQFEEYYGSFPHNITRFFGMTFVGLGDPKLPGTYRTFCGDEVTVRLVIHDGKIASINLLGRCTISGVLKSILVKRLGKGTGGLSTTQQGLMEQAGLPKEFIAFVGGEEP